MSVDFRVEIHASTLVFGISIMLLYRASFRWMLSSLVDVIAKLNEKNFLTYSRTAYVEL